jgi:D-alanyl-D-alanine carboxypeptidase
MTIRGLLFFAMLVVAMNAFAQKINFNQAVFLSAEVGSDQARGYSADVGSALDSAFDKVVALTPVKGFSAVMRLPDGTTWKRAAGLAAALPQPQTLTTDHLIGYGSITKTYVAATLLLLVEEGLCQLDDSIGLYLPTYPNVRGNITIRQILNHRSGLSDYATENPATFEYWRNNPGHLWSNDEILNNYVLAPNFPPDSAWSYSNTNYLLAGMLIEQLAGQPWYTVVRQRILTPLGLTHTFAYPWESTGSQPFAHVFSDLNGDGVVEDFQGSGLPVNGIFSMANSSGCMLGTAEDLAVFMEKLQQGQVLKPASLAAMKIDYQHDGSGFTYGLGLGSFPLPQALENWGHTGGIIYQSVALYLPSEHITLVVQQNDDRFFNPDDPNPVLDLYVVFIELLDAYLEYKQATGIAEPNTANQLLTMPNPTTGDCFLYFKPEEIPEMPIQLQVFDMMGQLVHTQGMEQAGAYLSLNNLPAGVYTISSGAYRGKIVKQ